MAVYGLEVPAGDVAITAKPEIPSAFRITMAAIDPSAEPEGEEGDVPRATLKIIRQSLIDYDDEDDYDAEDFDVEEMERMLAEEEDDDDEDSEEEANGGPSDPAKSKAARKAAAQKQIAALLAAQEEEMDVDEQPNGVNGKKSAKALGKMPASDDSEDDDEHSEDDEGEEYEEFVLCTLDPTKNYQQPLDITVGENERVLFKVSGTHSIFLTGNYVEPAHQPGPDGYDSEEDYDEEDYDLEPDSDELDDEEDELDDIEDPRITELEDEEEAPALVPSNKADKKAEKKGKNKRPAEDELANGASLDDLVTAAKKEANGEEKLTKKQKKQKKNDGTAAAVEEPSSAKSDKKVQFAKNLEQGPTPTKDAKKDDKSKAGLGVKKVGGVTIDDKKVGTGPAAKNGDRVGLRYIGKLVSNGKVFDSNKSGKPFTFKLGAGEVIKGWEIGIQGMTAGGERRITIPAKLAYGNKGAPPAIPGNADLVFDVKLLSIGGR